MWHLHHGQPPLLPSGQRKDRLERALQGPLAIFGDRVLPFDTDAARRYAGLAAAARAAGRELPTATASPLASLLDAQGDR